MSDMGLDVLYMHDISQNEKEIFLRVFAKMSSVDGHFDDSEREFIFAFSRDLGMSDQKTKSIIENLREEDLFKDASKIKDRRLALELIKEMCILAHADKDLSDEETLFIGEIGQAMGVELEKIAQISQWVIDYMVWQEQGQIIFEEV